MVQPLQENQISCPYCGEVISVLIDTTLSQQQYIEDCSVCCCPINVDIDIDVQGEIYISAKSENEI